MVGFSATNFHQMFLVSRNRGFHAQGFRFLCAGLGGYNYSEHTSALQQPRQLYPAGASIPMGHIPSFLVSCFRNYRQVSSHVNARASNGDAEIDDDISEIEAFTQIPNTKEHADGMDDDLVSEAECDFDEESAKYNAQDPRLAELDAYEKAGLEKSLNSELVKAMMNVPLTASVGSVLDKLVQGGYMLNPLDVSVAMARLKRRRQYTKALQLAEWADAKSMDLVEHNYACRLDLIAKVHGLPKAENYIKNIPKEFQTEAVYGTLLGNCVSARNPKKAEEVFNKMKDLGLLLTVVPCNQMLHLYRWFDKKKIADVLALMETERIMPDLATYTVLADFKGSNNDLKGVEQTIEHMKKCGVEPDLYFQAVVARHYISAGQRERAETILREMEGTSIEEENRAACMLVLPLYASLGKEDDVARVWSTCEKEPRRKECQAGIEAWGKLGHLEKAEEVFEIMHKVFENISVKYYNALLRLYARSGNLTKAKELTKRMSKDGCNIGPKTWDILVKMYLVAGEVEKADSMLRKAVEQSSERPFYTTYLGILGKYSLRGDIDRAENVFERMRKLGFVGYVGMYRSLLDAYVVAKVPAYGFRQRLKADGILPDYKLTRQLKTVDAYKKSRVLDIFD